MAEGNTEDTTIFEVVIDREGLYSIWPADRDCPRGWKPVGRSGRKDECLKFISEVWTDMRPVGGGWLKRPRKSSRS